MAGPPAKILRPVGPDSFHRPAAVEFGCKRRRAGYSLVRRPAEPECRLDANALGRRARPPARRQPHRAQRKFNPSFHRPAAVEPGRAGRRARPALVRPPADRQRGLGANNLGRRAKYSTSRAADGPRRNARPRRFLLGVVDQRPAISTDLDRTAHPVAIPNRERRGRGLRRLLAGAGTGRDPFVRPVGRRTTRRRRGTERGHPPARIHQCLGF